jgi:uracil phosphoribosyltransferase
MNVHILDSENSVLNSFIAEIRDHNIQKDPMRFRRNIERIGEILALEISKTLDYGSKIIQSPLGSTSVNLPENELVICSILRAGLPLHQGLLNYFDHAGNAFISAYRKHSDPYTFEIEVEYLASPDLTGKTLILADPMLATGRSIISVLEGLREHGTPQSIHLACVIGSTHGLAYLEKLLPKTTQLWIATVDDQLDERNYIVPGLGDAGDLAYGEKT